MRGWLLAAAVAQAAAAQFPAVSHTLHNGMQVIVAEDHTIPDVAVQFFFCIGSRNERPGVTGISHFLEHMMFNGSRRYGPRQFDTAMERNGGDNNAYTTRDITVYTDWVPREALELAMRMEADRIQNLTFDPALVESERGVVTSERRSSVDDSSIGTLLEQLYATAFLAHPYRWPILGWPSDIKSWTIDDLRAQYRMGYGPNNCVAVLAGDVTPGDAFALARKYLEPIQPHQPPPPVRAIEPPQIGERRVTARKAVQMPGMLAGYHVPASNHPDHWPLEALIAIMAEGRSSRLYIRLVENSDAALSVSAWLTPSLDPGLLIFRMQPRDAAAAERGFDRVMAQSVAAEPTAAEMEKTRHQLLADHYRRLRTNSGKAGMLGEYQIYFGDYRRLFKVPEEIARIRAADVLRVARTYLGRWNRTVAVMGPREAR